MAFFMPPLGSTTEDGQVSSDQQYLMSAVPRRGRREGDGEKETEQVAENNADNKEGGTGTRAKGEEGSMGNPNTKATGKRFGVQGPEGQPRSAHRRAGRPSDAAEFGMIGLLNWAPVATQRPHGPVGPRRLARQRPDERPRQHVGRRHRRLVRRGRPRPLGRGRGRRWSRRRHRPRQHRHPRPRRRHRHRPGLRQRSRPPRRLAPHEAAAGPPGRRRR
jgi:hypothetical protein